MQACVRQVHECMHTINMSEGRTPAASGGDVTSASLHAAAAKATFPSPSPSPSPNHVHAHSTAITMTMTMTPGGDEMNASLHAAAAKATSRRLEGGQPIRIGAPTRPFVRGLAYQVDRQMLCKYQEALKALMCSEAAVVVEREWSAEAQREVLALTLHPAPSSLIPHPSSLIPHPSSLILTPTPTLTLTQGSQRAPARSYLVSDVWRAGGAVGR